MPLPRRGFRNVSSPLGLTIFPSTGWLACASARAKSALPITTTALPDLFVSLFAVSGWVFAGCSRLNGRRRHRRFANRAMTAEVDLKFKPGLGWHCPGLVRHRLFPPDKSAALAPCALYSLRGWLVWGERRLGRRCTTWLGGGALSCGSWLVVWQQGYWLARLRVSHQPGVSFPAVAERSRAISRSLSLIPGMGASIRARSASTAYTKKISPSLWQSISPGCSYRRVPFASP